MMHWSQGCLDVRIYIFMRLKFISSLWRSHDHHLRFTCRKQCSEAIHLSHIHQTCTKIFIFNEKMPLDPGLNSPEMVAMVVLRENTHFLKLLTHTIAFVVRHGTPMLMPKRKSYPESESSKQKLGTQKPTRRSRCSKEEKHSCPVCSQPDCGECKNCV